MTRVSSLAPVRLGAYILALAFGVTAAVVGIPGVVVMLWLGWRP